MTAKLLIQDVPPSIREAVEEAARTRDRSVNTVVVGALADWLGVGWEPPAYPFTEVSGSSDWLLRMPDELRDAVRKRADEIDGSMRGVVLLALSDTFDLPAHSPRRRHEPALTAQLVAEARRRNRQGESIRKLSRELGVHRETLTKAVRA